MIASILDLLSSELIELLKQQAFYTTLLFVPVLAISRLLKNKAPLILLCLWTLVLLRLVLPPEFASPVSVREVFDSVIPAASSVNDIPVLQEFYFGDGSAPAITSLPVLLTWNSLYITIWLAITIALLCRYGHQRHHFQRLIKQGTQIQEPKLLATLDFWQAHYRIRRHTRLVATTACLTPFTVGIWQPVIVLPQALLKKLPHEQLDAIIAHEMTHVKRFDDAWIHLQHWLQCLFFFAPVVWLCNAQINRLRELVVDRIVLAHQNMSSLHYGRAMLAVLKLNQPSKEPSVKALPIAGFVTARQFYATRFKALGSAKSHQGKKHLLEVLLIGAALLFILPMAPTPQSINAERQHIYNLSDTMIPTGITQLISPLQEGHMGYPFGVRKTYFGILQQEDMHMGVDINADLGSPVGAIGSGIVEIASDNASDGFFYISSKFVVIRHDNGMRSLLGPLYNLQVQKGDRVEAGQTVGHLDKSLSANNPQPHIHLEVSRDGIRIDPAKVIDFTRLTTRHHQALAHVQ